MVVGRTVQVGCISLNHVLLTDMIPASDALLSNHYCTSVRSLLPQRLTQASS